MNDVGRVEGFESSKGLVDEVLRQQRENKVSEGAQVSELSFEVGTNLSVVVRKILRSNDSVHISLHELLDD